MIDMDGVLHDKRYCGYLFNSASQMILSDLRLMLEKSYKDLLIMQLADGRSFGTLC